MTKFAWISSAAFIVCFALLLFRKAIRWTWTLLFLFMLLEGAFLFWAGMMLQSRL